METASQIFSERLTKNLWELIDEERLHGGIYLCQCRRLYMNTTGNFGTKQVGEKRRERKRTKGAGQGDCTWPGLGSRIINIRSPACPHPFAARTQSEWKPWPLLEPSDSSRSSRSGSESSGARSLRSKSWNGKQALATSDRKPQQRISAPFPISNHFSVLKTAKNCQTSTSYHELPTFPFYPGQRRSPSPNFFSRGGNRNHEKESNPLASPYHL